MSENNNDIPQNAGKSRRGVLLLVFLLSFLSVMSTARDFGMGWDEGADRLNASLTEEWLRLAFTAPVKNQALSRDSITKYWNVDLTHPPVTRLYYAVVHIAFGDISRDEFYRNVVSYRIGSAILFGMMAAAVYYLATLYFGMGGGLIAAVACGAMPHVFGLAHFMCSDLMVCASMVVCAAVFYRSKDRLAFTLLFAVMTALLASAKLTGAIATVPMFLWALMFDRKLFLRNFFAALIIAPVVFYLMQPLAWRDPAGYVVDFIKAHTGMTTVNYILVPYFGRIYSGTPPVSYASVLAAITMPLPIMAAVLAGAFFAFRREWRFMLFIGFNAFFYIVVFTVAGTPVYDGIRLFAQSMPFFAVAAGALWLPLRERLTRRTSVMAAVVLTLCFAMPVVQVHPHELSYYNGLIGGLRGAAARGLEVIYWGEALSPAVLADISDMIPDGGTISVAGSNPYNFDYYGHWGLLRKGITIAQYGTVFDYVLIVNRSGQLDPMCRYFMEKGSPVYRLEHDGVPIVSLYHVVMPGGSGERGH